MFLSLRLRLLLALSGVVVLIVALLGYFFSRATTSEFERYVEQDFLDYERLVNPFIVQKLENFLRFRRVDCDLSLQNWLECQSESVSYSSETLTEFQAIVKEMAEITGTRIVIADSVGRIIANSDWGKIEEDPNENILGNVSGVFVIEGDPFLVYINLTEESGIGASQRAFINTVNRSLQFAMLSAVTAAIFLTVMLSRRILRPISALTSAASLLGKGDLSQRVKISTKDEIGELANAFNVMADGLFRLENLRRNMVSDVAHELRTPLSNVRGYLEAIQDGLTDPTRDIIDSLHEEVMLLNRLVEDLQELALAEAGKLDLKPMPVDLSTIVDKSIIALQPKINEKQINILKKIPKDLPTIEVDPERIGQVLRNLISNAIVYTPENGTITIEGRLMESGIEVNVQDNGVGISPEHLTYVFERFYRVDESRTRSTGGAGLGLAIVKQLVNAHGGQINVDSVLGSGTSITFTLPLVTTS